MGTSRVRLNSSTVSQRHVVAAKASNTRQLKGVPPYDKDKVTHVKKLVSAMRQSLDGLHSAVSEMTLVKSHEISPDGKLGGLGYIMPIKDFKDSLGAALNTVSNLMDTLADELTNPNWGLSPEDIKSILAGGDTSAEAPAEDEPFPEDNSIAEPGNDDDLLPTGDEDLLPTGDDAPAEGGMGDVPEKQEPAPQEPVPQEKQANPEGLPVPPPSSMDKPALPYTRVLPLPYMKLASRLNKHSDPVAGLLRAPILFNMLSDESDSGTI